MPGVLSTLLIDFDPLLQTDEFGFEPMQRRVPVGITINEYLKTYYGLLSHDIHDISHSALCNILGVPFYRKKTWYDVISELNLTVKPGFNSMVGDNDMFLQTPDIVVKSWLEGYEYIILDPTVTMNVTGARSWKKDKYNFIAKSVTQRIKVIGVAIPEETCDLCAIFSSIGLNLSKTQREMLLRYGLMMARLIELNEDILKNFQDPKHARDKYLAHRKLFSDIPFPDPGLTFSDSNEFLEKFHGAAFFTKSDCHDAIHGDGIFADESNVNFTEKDNLIFEGICESIKERLEIVLPGVLNILTKVSDLSSIKDESILSDLMKEMFDRYKRDRSDNPSEVVEKCHLASKSWKDCAVDNSMTPRLIPLPMVTIRSSDENLDSLMNSIVHSLHGLVSNDAVLPDLIPSLLTKWIMANEHSQLSPILYGNEVLGMTAEQAKTLSKQTLDITGKHEIHQYLTTEQRLSVGVGIKSDRRRHPEDYQKQYLDSKTYDLDADTSCVDRLKFIFLGKTIKSQPINKYPPFDNESMSEIERSSERECCKELNSFVNLSSNLYISDYLLFLSAVYKQLSVMAHKQLDTDLFQFGIVSGYNLLLILGPGESIDSPSCVRRFKMIYQSDGKLEEFCNWTGPYGDWSCTSWEYLTPWHVSQFGKCHDTYEALTMRYTQEEMRLTREGICLESLNASCVDYICGIVPIFLINGRHHTYELLQNSRYIMLSVMSMFSNMTKMFCETQLKSPLRNIAQVYILKHQLNFYSEHKDNANTKGWSTAIHRIIYDDSTDDRESWRIYVCA